jgi:hypothetical protein
MSEPNERPAGGWIPGPTAVLVVHGVGNQEPLQTLDQFGRGLLLEFKARGWSLDLQHRVAASADSRCGAAQSLRLHPPGGGPPLDVYEYYWADIPQDRAPLGAIQRWLDGAVKGARAFYRDNEKLVAKYEQGGSLFFRGGRFNYWRYWWFLFLVGQAIPTVTGTLQWLVNLVRSIPLAGQWLSVPMSRLEDDVLDLLTNVAGDVVVFNSVQARSPFLGLRESILRGCVKALRGLVEPEGDGPWSERAWKYDRVIVAGHSLGSQVGFEAINRLNLLAATGQLRGIDASGHFSDGRDRIAVRGRRVLGELLGGFVTFGSPLDKVAFFFREQAKAEESIRRRMLGHLRGFKQKPWDPGEIDGLAPEGFGPPLARLLDEVRWVNYFDRNDPVSGSLDYYEPLENRGCNFAVKYTRGRLRTLAVGGVIWLLAGLGAVGYWAAKVWSLSWTSLQRFSVGGFLMEHWTHWVMLALFVVGTLALLAGFAVYFAGTFTHLRYWNQPESPLYRDLVDEFLTPAEVKRMSRAGSNTGDVA